jgi:hypothetical protein
MSTKKVIVPKPVIVHKHAAIPPVAAPLAVVNEITLADAVIALAHAVRIVADDVRLKGVVADMDRLIALL